MAFLFVLDRAPNLRDIMGIRHAEDPTVVALFSFETAVLIYISLLIPMEYGPVGSTGVCRQHKSERRRAKIREQIDRLLLRSAKLFRPVRSS